ncbi:MAG: Hsp20/alpha crystallin family protein [Planctomycetes bacterium]|nr:Hsp20/alpha crystallin family protein [Planctomycetota bacterium]
MVLRDIMPFKKPGRAIRVRSNAEDYPLQGLQSRMNRLFEDFFGDWGLEPLGGPAQLEREFLPSIDVAQTDKEITVTAELAGMDQKDIELTLDDDILTIRGEKKQQNEHTDAKSFHRECSYGSFVRSIQLPVQVEQGKIKAEFKKGVLTVHLPKSATETPRAKKIDIQSD